MRRKFMPLFMLFSALVCALNCRAQTSGEKPCRFLSFAEAERILGQPVELVANSWTFTEDTTRFECHYRAIEKNTSAPREVNLFLLFEESANEDEARAVYQTIWNSNKNHRGIEILSLPGDEAYAHSDRKNFHFVMARKGKFTFRLKINRAVETDSFDQLKAYAKRLIERI